MGLYLIVLSAISKNKETAYEPLFSILFQIYAPKVFLHFLRGAYYQPHLIYVVCEVHYKSIFSLVLDFSIVLSIRRWMVTAKPTNSRTARMIQLLIRKIDMASVIQRKVIDTILALKEMARYVI